MLRRELERRSWRRKVSQGPSCIGYVCFVGSERITVLSKGGHFGLVEAPEGVVCEAWDGERDAIEHAVERGPVVVVADDEAGALAAIEAGADEAALRTSSNAEILARIAR